MTNDTEAATLTGFLLARIAEDEDAARNAQAGRWKLWGMTVMADPAGTSNVDDCVEVASTLTPAWCERAPRTWNANHIARHDPSRVLAECESKRRIVDAALRFDADRITPSTPQPVANEYAGVLATLAAVYADHPDYRDKWRP